MATERVVEGASRLADQAGELARGAEALAREAAALAHVSEPMAAATADVFWWLVMIFVLAIFVGYYVVWRVTPALHSPLLSVTNAVSSVIIVGALIAAGPDMFSTSKVLGFIAVTIASVNIFGGFIVTQRMLHMYKKKGK